jgi:phytol kinase
MNLQLLYLFLFLGLLILLIGITELLHRYFKFKPETSRKFLHVSGGLMCLPAPHFFKSHWWILVLASLSFILLLVTFLMNKLQSVHKTERKSIGSIIFPIPVYFCFLTAELLHNNLYFYLPISLLTISDTTAEIAGNRWGPATRQFFSGQKTLAGTIGFFVTAMFVCFGWLYYYDIRGTTIILLTVILSVATSLTELVTLKGWDNLTVPIVANVILWIFFTITTSAW